MSPEWSQGAGGHGSGCSSIVGLTYCVNFHIGCEPSATSTIFFFLPERAYPFRALSGDQRSCLFGGDREVWRWKVCRRSSLFSRTGRVSCSVELVKEGSGGEA